MTTQPTTRTTPTDLKPGDRVRVTFEGTVTYVIAGAADLRADNGDSVTVSFADRTTTTTVERVRPAVPTGLGAVVRLDGPDGPLACSVPGKGRPIPAWIVGSDRTSFHDGHELAARIVDVLSPGVEL